MPAWPQCQSERLVNNGSVAGKPKKLCTRCGFQFTRTTPRGKPLTTKITAVLLYLSGLSRHRIAFLLRVSAPSVLNRIRTFAKAHEEKPEPAGKTIVLQLDEMWHDLKKTRQKLWIWKALDHDTGQLLGWECGRRDKATLKKLVDRLARWEVKLYGTDQWGTYASVIPQDKRVQSKATTHAIERHHGRQRRTAHPPSAPDAIIRRGRRALSLRASLVAVPPQAILGRGVLRQPAVLCGHQAGYRHAPLRFRR